MSEVGITNALSVDVEDYFHVAAFDSVIDRRDWGNIQSRVVKNTRQVLELFEFYNVKATFFVLGLVAEEHPGLVKEISDAGHELASHGYSHKKIYQQTQAEFKEETRRAKGILEDISGKCVIGYRAASFSITRESLWALDVLIDEGFQYDSSIFPVHHDNYGIPGAGCEPAEILSPNNKPLVEFPLNTTSILGFRFPIGGGGYFRLYPYWLSRAGLRRINRNSQPFVFYMHPWEMDPEQPRISAGLVSRFRHYNNLDKFGSRMQRLLSSFQFAPCREVLLAQGLLSPVSSRDFGR